MELFTFGAEQEDNGKRLDVFLAENIEEVTRSQIAKWIFAEKVSVNGSGKKANYRLRTADIVEVQIEPPVELEILAEDIPLDILYEDAELIVVNKPQGMVVHPAPGHYTGTLVNALLYHCKEELSGINGVLRPGIVHRIDKDTSGVLVAAKTNRAHQSLAGQLSVHSIRREYHAICYNRIKEAEGTVDAPIGRHPQDRKRMTVTEKNSRHAVTHYQVLEYLQNYTYFAARLETGRTHQIRVHMAHIGHPLLGDPVYGPKKQPFPLNGQALHARALGFIHPKTGEYMEFEAELPAYFCRLLSKLQNEKR